MGREMTVISRCLGRGHLLGTAVGARNPVAHPPLNTFLHADSNGHLPWQLLLCARAEMVRDLLVPQPPCRFSGVPHDGTSEFLPIV